MLRITRRNAAHWAVPMTGVLLASLLCASPGWAQRFPVPWKSSKTERVEIRGPEHPLLGNADAPVTIVSFSDYRCPYCRQLSDTLEDLLEQYPDGIRVIYRHYAHTAESRALSTAALCAAEQDKFAEYHQLAFKAPAASADALIGLADSLRLDLEKFRSCTASSRYESRIDGDAREGERLGIQVTPTIFINGERLVGAAPAAGLRARIDKLLSAASVE